MKEKKKTCYLSHSQISQSSLRAVLELGQILSHLCNTFFVLGKKLQAASMMESCSAIRTLFFLQIGEKIFPVQLCLTLGASAHLCFLTGKASVV